MNQPIAQVTALPNSPDDTTAHNQQRVEETLRALAVAWSDFESRLERVPLVAKLNRGRFTEHDYRTLLLNLRQQVIDGGCWIARAASSISIDYFDLRSHFLQHASVEHRDYQMLEDDYEAMGGDPARIKAQNKNIGSEALSAFMFHRASQPNPFDLLGAMFMIEGLGLRKAGSWSDAITTQLSLAPNQIRFLRYHSENDSDHLDEFQQWLQRVLISDAVAERMLQTARTVGRLYLLQLEEVIEDTARD